MYLSISSSGANRVLTSNGLGQLPFAGCRHLIGSSISMTRNRMSTRWSRWCSATHTSSRRTRCSTTRRGSGTLFVARAPIVSSTFALCTSDDSSNSRHLGCFWFLMWFSSPLCLGSTWHLNVSRSSQFWSIRGRPAILAFNWLQAVHVGLS